MRHHDECRDVVLGEDFWAWEAAIQRRWIDFIVPDVEVDFHLVLPAPTTAATPNEIHIILAQNLREFECSSLVTTYDNAVLRGAPYTAAIILPSAVLNAEIVRAAGKAAFCPPQAPTATCTCWHGGVHIPEGRRYPNRNGFAFVLIIHRQLPSNFWEEDYNGWDGVNLLQTRAVHQPAGEGRLTTGQVAHTQWPSHADQDRHQTIDFHEPILAFEGFDSHFFLPELALEHICDAHPAHSWLQDWWDFATPGSEIWVYYDGSATCFDGKPSVTAAAAAFIKIYHKWYFAGAVAAPLPFARDSYAAEHYASAISLKLGYDLLKLHEAMGSATPTLHFCFDSLTVGHQTAGLWHCFKHPVLGAVLRNIHRLIETRFDPTIFHWHVKGHSGHPGNELVDSLAQQAHEREPDATTDWLAMLGQNSFKSCSDWFWILFDTEFHAFWDQHQLHLAMPGTQPHVDLLHSPAPLPHSEGPVQVHLRLATCNVLSLCGARDEHECGLSGPARQQMLLQQFSEEGITIFALQETRLKRIHRAHADDYFLFRAAATAKGHYGIVVGIAKHMTFASTITDGKTREFQFKEHHVSIILETPRALILRINTGIIRFLVIAGHAPHTGHPQDEINHWWHEISASIPKAYQDWPVILLADANASVGHHPSDAIGDYHAGPFEVKSEGFENFVHRHHIWLPSTFEDSQRGPSATWFHTSGKSRRIDYVGVPRDWPATHCEAWTSDIVDPSITKTDHLAACVDLRFLWTCTPSRSAQRHHGRLHIECKDLNLHGLLQQPSIEPHVDVHTHAAQLQSALLEALHSSRRPAAPAPRKKTMSTSTWELVLQKRAARRHLAELNKRQRLDVLELLFDTWRQRNSLQVAFIHDYNQLFSAQDLLIAKAWSTFRQLGRQVVQALRFDDMIFFQALLAEGADLLTPADVRRFWAVIRRSLPRFKQRKASPAPARIEALEDQLVPYLCELELGEPIAEHDLVLRCHQRQLATMLTLPTEPIAASALPTLTAFETSLRTTTPHRATGLDLVPAGVHHEHASTTARFYYSLLLKIHLWCAEPIQFKGGVMCMIHKKGNLTEASNYRGILLLASIAKRIHSLTRTTLMRTLEPHRAVGQLGGFSHQMVQFGFHAVNTWTRTLAAQGLSTAVLYLDLKSAFHHLLREFALGVSDQIDFDNILADLRAAGHPLDAAFHGQRFIGALESIGGDPRLLQLLRDIHTDTWFTLSQAELIRTRRGTRPGSPLADAIFHVVMAQIMSEVRSWIYTQEAFVDQLKAF